MQSCAVALGKYHIRANAVLPGTIETDINKDDLSDAAKREGMVKRTALGRLGGASRSCVLLSKAGLTPYSPRRYCRPRSFPGERPGKVRDGCTSTRGRRVVRQSAIVLVE